MAAPWAKREPPAINSGDVPWQRMTLCLSRNGVSWLSSPPIAAMSAAVRWITLGRSFICVFLSFSHSALLLQKNRAPSRGRGPMAAY
jgi:hypothetical protein